jgi:nitroreductase
MVGPRLIASVTEVELQEALYTTRAMRRVRPDPIPDDVIARITDAAIRAPSGGNQQRWRFVLVTDPVVKEPLARWYKEGLDELNRTQYRTVMELIESGDPSDPAVVQAKKTHASAVWLADNLAKVPLLLFAFGKPNGESSMFPALWSAQLAARAEGIGTSLTTLLFRYRKAEVLELLGVPTDGDWVPMAMVTFGYPTGRWAVANRKPAHEVVYRERWGEPVAWRVDEPLWP